METKNSRKWLFVKRISHKVLGQKVLTISRENFRTLWKKEGILDKKRGSNFMGYPGQNHRQGGEEVFLKKIGAKSFFFRKRKNGGEEIFRKKRVKSSYGIHDPEPSSRG